MRYNNPRYHTVVGLIVKEYNGAFTKVNMKAVCKSIVATHVLDGVQGSLRRRFKKRSGVVDTSLDTMSLLALAYVMMPNHRTLTLDHLLVKATVMKVNKSHNIPSINGSIAKFVQKHARTYIFNID